VVQPVDVRRPIQQQKGAIKFETDEPIEVEVRLDNKVTLRMQIDSGSANTIVPRHMYEKHFKNCELKPSNIKLIDYGGNPITLGGKIEIEVSFRKKNKILEVVIAENGNQLLLGRNFLKLFDFYLMNERVNSIEQNEKPQSLQSLINAFKSLFSEGLGCFKFRKIKLELIENSKPKFFKPRVVPFALKPIVDRELEKLENMGVIEKVDTSDFGTPLVPIVKPDGTLRICGDYKITLNQLLKDMHHPLPRIEEIFHKLRNGEKFSTLDMNCAYNQFELDKDSKLLAAWSTTKGIYKMNRLSYGIKTASNI